MPDSDSPRVTTLLPDTLHQVAKPGTAVVRLETTHERQGVLDGAWWPQSRDIAAELPALITALTEYLGPVTRIGLDATAWERLPTRLNAEGSRTSAPTWAVGFVCPDRTGPAPAGPSAPPSRSG